MVNWEWELARWPHWMVVWDLVGSLYMYEAGFHLGDLVLQTRLCGMDHFHQPSQL